MASTKTYVQLKEKYDRVVVLIDMDCFYCQVEEYLDPERLSGKPIAVVQYLENAGIIAVNYAARALGVTRHMREKEAKQVCSELICVKVPSKNGKADLTKYRDAGYQVAKVLQTFTPLLERASVDEAYLDITENVVKKMQELRNNQFQLQPANFVNTYAVGYENVGLFVQDVTSSVGKNYDHIPEDERKAYASSKLRLLIGAAIVNEIRAAVKEQTKYECSAGIAHNKILAKLTCGFNKPNKQTVLPIESISSLFNDLAINKVKSMGGKLGEEVCSKLQAKTMSDVLKYSESELQQLFQARIGSWLYLMARGIDLEKVTPKFMSKSIAVSKNFRGKNEISNVHTLKFWLKELSKEIVERLEKDEADCNRLSKHLSVSFTQGEAKNDGKNVSSSRVVPLNGNALNSYTAEQIAEEAFETIKKSSGKFLKAEGAVIMTLNIKHLGITAGKFEDKNAAGSSKAMQNLLKNHQKREVLKSPPQAGPSRGRKKKEESEVMDKSTAIAAIRKFEMKSPKTMMKVPQPLEASLAVSDDPERLLAVTTQFAGENAIRGIKTLRHWITQNMLEICRNLEIDSEMNLRAPTEITVKYKQIIGSELKENCMKFPLEGFSNGVIDVDVLVETLKNSEEFLVNNETGGIQNPITHLEIHPSSFRDGKQWKFAMRQEKPVEERTKNIEIEGDNSMNDLNNEEEMEIDPEVDDLELHEDENALEASEMIQKETSIIENCRNTAAETQQQDVPEETAQHPEPNHPENTNSNQISAATNVNEPEELENSIFADDDSNDENDESFGELIKNEQRKILEDENSKDSSKPPEDDNGISYSPAYDATTDEEDIFAGLEENSEESSDEVKENLQESRENQLEISDSTKFEANSSKTSTSGATGNSTSAATKNLTTSGTTKNLTTNNITTTTSAATKNPTTSTTTQIPPTTTSLNDTSGPSYLQTYAEFQLPEVSIDILNPKEVCPECGKMVGKLDMTSHLDHHLAFQIANQQREEYRKQQKPTSSQVATKKVAAKPKPQSKTPQNSIQKYVVKKDDSFVEEQPVENKIQCEQCLKFISNDDYVSHLDYHFAQKLRAEEMKSLSQLPKAEVKRPSVKRPGSTQKNLPKMKSVKTYFQ